MTKLYIGLIHYPVYNKHKERVMTSVTNLDIHDIARTSKCYGAKAFHIISPDHIQQQIVHRVCEFWKTNQGLMYNPDRSEALSMVRCNDSIEDFITQITSQEGMSPIIVTTTARELPAQISYRCFRDFLNESRPIALLFGTGNGLCDEVHQQADYILQPIKGAGSFKHLSVRSAVAIVMDRISSVDINGRNNGYSATNRQRPNQNRLSRLSRRRYGQSPL